jgi:hypothetical protein
MFFSCSPAKLIMSKKHAWDLKERKGVFLDGIPDQPA